MPCIGVDMLIKVNTGTQVSPVWKSVGGQRGASLSRSTDEIDTTSKSSGGWHTGKPGIKNWGAEGDGVLIKNDEAYAALIAAWKADEQVMLQLVRADMTVEEGLATLVDFPEEGPYDGEATYSMSFIGSGPLTEA